MIGISAGESSRLERSSSRDGLSPASRASRSEYFSRLPTGVVFAMPCCSAFGCRTRETGGKRLFRIPSAKRDAAQRKVWLQRISRADFNPTQWSRLCEVSERFFRKMEESLCETAKAASHTPVR
ncbi:hypothetical protein HPB49_015212 [Dermacentor silvarum]|uniref:Uncharacterized protein n=1 Tax=Dermacentor silvarum TaxID=543639 RepID=A0ACB8DDW6_DERSI|nr:hypothetical protein HPB49_015212 [Dermacentor silvarum]